MGRRCERELDLIALRAVNRRVLRSTRSTWYMTFPGVLRRLGRSLGYSTLLDS